MQATAQYANGDRYVGEFWDDLRHGEGTLLYANGDRYEVCVSVLCCAALCCVV